MSQPQQSPRRTVQDPWNWRIAKIADIPIRIHVSFVILLGYVAIDGDARSWGTRVVFCLCLFLCVTLHELGHALVARQFGARTSSITLYPLGGVAMINDPLKPIEEFCMTIAGPLVNVLIAVVLGLILWQTGSSLNLDSPGFFSRGLMTQLLVANVGLAVFNLIPAFPMDGGRILRSLLSMVISPNKATLFTSYLGRFIAILFVAFGFIGREPFLALIGFFVFLGASQEGAAARFKSRLEGRTVGELMLSRFHVLTHGDTLGAAESITAQTGQRDFPVESGSELVGVLSQAAIEHGLASEGSGAYVAGYMQREFGIVSPQTLIPEAVELFRRYRSAPLVVKQDQNLVGILPIGAVRNLVQGSNSGR